MLIPPLATQADDVLHLQHLANERIADGLPVYPLVLGESNLPTPDHIIQASIGALSDGQTRYAPSRGTPELLTAIAEKLERDNQIFVDPLREVFVTNGSAMGILLALQAVTRPGNDVIVSDPTYGPFLDAIRLAGCRPCFAPLQHVSGQLRWDSTAIEEQISHRTHAILINTPSAPGGAVMGRDELQMIGAIADKHDLTIITDEVFEHLIYKPHRHLSIAALDPAFAARTISVFSFSKSYRMTGWRLGYNVAPAEIIERLDCLSMATGRLAAPFVQSAGVAALTGSQQCIAGQRDEYTGRLEQIEKRLEQISGLTWLRPEGAFYIYLDSRTFGSDSRGLAEDLLRTSGVVLTPGTFYGPAGQGWLRLSFAGAPRNTFDGIDALATALASRPIRSQD